MEMINAVCDMNEKGAVGCDDTAYEDRSLICRYLG